MFILYIHVNSQTGRLFLAVEQKPRNDKRTMRCVWLGKQPLVLEDPFFSLWLSLSVSLSIRSRLLSHLPEDDSLVLQALVDMDEIRSKWFSWISCSLPVPLARQTGIAMIFR